MYKKLIILIITLILILSVIPNVTSYNISKKPNDINNNSGEYWGLLIAVGKYLNNPNQDRPSMLVRVEEL